MAGQTTLNVRRIATYAACILWENGPTDKDPNPVPAAASREKVISSTEPNKANAVDDTYF